jgi:hypothetical protein
LTGPTYDRQLVLLGAKRNAVLELWEVQRYGSDGFANPDYVSIYGLRPEEWYARGIRLLGRTAVECTRDRLADAIGREIAATAHAYAPTPRVMVIDPFAGSGNSLCWIMHHLPHASGVGFEVDPQVFQLTRQNLEIMGLPIQIRQADYAQAVRELSVPPEVLLVAFIAPPWGNALSESDGLDLRYTSPPASEVVDLLAQRFDNPMLVGIQMYEQLVEASVVELSARFEWSALRIYDFDAPGHNHGMLLATRGWQPEAGWVMTPTYTR